MMPVKPKKLHVSKNLQSKFHKFQKKKKNLVFEETHIYMYLSVSFVPLRILQRIVGSPSFWWASYLWQPEKPKTTMEEDFIIYL